MLTASQPIFDYSCEFYFILSLLNTTGCIMNANDLTTKMPKIVEFANSIDLDEATYIYISVYHLVVLDRAILILQT